MKKLFWLPFGLLFSALVAEHVWLYRHLAGDTERNLAHADELALLHRQAEAARRDADLSLALCRKRGEALAEDMDLCMQDLDSMRQEPCIPASAYDALVQEVKEWKYTYTMVMSDCPDVCLEPGKR